MQRLIILLGLLLGALMPAVAGAQSSLTFQGTVRQSPVVALNANGQILFEIFEDSNTVPVYAVRQVVGAAAPPYSFSVTVSSSTFKPSHTYILRATLAEGTAVRGQGSVPIANGGSTTLSIVTLPATGTLPMMAGGEIFLLVGLIFALLAGAALLWRELRLRRVARLPR